MKYYNNIVETIGNTPLVKLNKVVKDVPALVLAKVESFNPGNSVKDRIGIRMIEDAEKAGLIKPGGTIVEGTSGNTGMGLALAAIAKGYKCIFATTDKQSKEKSDVLRALGAEVIVCPTNVEPDDPRSYYSVSRRLATEIPNAYYPNQYDNLSNTAAHYSTTGPEIWEQTEGKVTHLVVATGTGGTISGTGKYLKEKNPNIQLWAIDTYGSVLKKYHETREFDEKEIYPYISEGFGEDILPKNVNFDLIDKFEKVTDKDGAIMAREVTKKEGIFVGYSGGSVIQGLLQLKHLLKPTDVVVVIFHDHGSRYVAKVYNDDWMRERGFLEVKSVKDIVNSRSKYELISVEPHQPVSDAIKLMKQRDVEQIPVLKEGKVVGSITQNLVFNALVENGSVQSKKVEEIMDKPFSQIPLDTTIERLSTMITKEQPAVMALDQTTNQLHIVTKYDVINALAK